MSKPKMEKLKRSIERFDFVEIPAIDQDGKIISGHQRLMAMQLLGRGSDVMIKNRKKLLTLENIIKKIS